MTIFGHDPGDFTVGALVFTPCGDAEITKTQGNVRSVTDPAVITVQLIKNSEIMEFGPNELDFPSMDEEEEQASIWPYPYYDTR